MAAGKVGSARGRRLPVRCAPSAGTRNKRGGLNGLSAREEGLNGLIAREEGLNGLNARAEGSNGLNAREEGLNGLNAREEGRSPGKRKPREDGPGRTDGRGSMARGPCAASILLPKKLEPYAFQGGLLCNSPYAWECSSNALPRVFLDSMLLLCASYALPMPFL